MAMTDAELLTALGRIAVQDQHRCLGCGYEHNCGIHGCRIIREAESRLLGLAGKDSNVPTADELFQAAGYRLVERNPNGTVLYENPNGCADGGISIISISLQNERSFSKLAPNNPYHCSETFRHKSMTEEEIIACAQLIKEMEADQ